MDLPRTILSIGMLACVAAAGACAPQRLHGRLTPAELESRLREDFVVGMSKGEVDGALDAARVPRRDRVMYPASAGGEGSGGAGERVYLVRLFEPGGHWSDFYDERVEFSDVTFVFAHSGALAQRGALAERGAGVGAAAGAGDGSGARGGVETGGGGASDAGADDDAALTLARVGVFYDVIRYIEDRPSGGLRREPAARARSYPALPPPPRDPLEGVRWIVGAGAAEGER